MILEISVGNKATKSLDPSRLIQLLNLKNQYKVAHIVRNLIIIALVVAGIACGILAGGAAIGAVMFLGFIGWHLYAITKNNKLVKELQTTGLRPGMEIA